MADMGFLPQVEWLLRHIDGRHQTLLFSATLDGVVDGLIKRYQHDPVYHEVASATVTVDAMIHRFIAVHEMDKVKVAAAIARGSGKTLAFTHTKRVADRLARALNEEGVHAAAIHGDLRQGQREDALKQFGEGKLQVLVATDVAARGLHIDDVDVVIHYEPAPDHKTYLHRSGRTARAGSKGLAVSLSLWNEELHIKRLQKRIGVIQPITEMFSNDPRLDDLTAWTPGTPVCGRSARCGSDGTASAAMAADADLDPMQVGLFSYRVFSKLEGAVTSAMVHLGDRLGLYRALADADSPLTSTELADRLGLDERWVREWAYNQGAAEIVQIDDDERLSLAPEAVAVLADEEHPAFGMGSFHHLPQTMAALELLPESFRTGLGLDYDAHGPDCAEGVARGFEPWMRANLLPTVLPALDGVEAKLRDGATVLDVGCGAGGVVLVLAAAFPASRITGYDISQHALARAASGRPRRASPMRPSPTRGRTRCRPTGRPTSSSRSTACTT